MSSKLCLAVVLTVFVFCITCDPTRATPSRERRQGWSWGGDDDVQPPPRPTSSSTTSTTTAAAPVASSTERTQCIANCRATNEFNPVCGSNRITYDNIGKLNCARNCGVAVERIFTGTCSPAPPS